jgi:hypothetical protein
VTTSVDRSQRGRPRRRAGERDGDVSRQHPKGRCVQVAGCGLNGAKLSATPRAPVQIVWMCGMYDWTRGMLWACAVGGLLQAGCGSDTVSSAAEDAATDAADTDGAEGGADATEDTAGDAAQDASVVVAIDIVDEGVLGAVPGSEFEPCATWRCNAARDGVTCVPDNTLPGGGPPVLVCCDELDCASLLRVCVTGLPWTDTAASAPPAPNAPNGVAATVDRPLDVSVTWLAATSRTGAPALYSVQAVACARESLPAVHVTGYRRRRRSPATRCRWMGSAWEAVGAGLEWFDEAVPAGSITSETATASTNFSDRVDLSVPLPALNPGAVRTYRVRARNAAGAGTRSDGSRGVVVRARAASSGSGRARSRGRGTIWRARRRAWHPTPRSRRVSRGGIVCRCRPKVRRRASRVRCRARGLAGL